RRHRPRARRWPQRQFHKADTRVWRTHTDFHITRRVQRMAKHIIVFIALCGLMAGVVLGDTGRGEDADRGAQPQELTVTTTERPWYHEAEFATTPGLRARPHQVVILHLEPGGKRNKHKRNTIPYLFEETATFNFCVPVDDPHIRSLELQREDSRRVVVQVHQGAPCMTQRIAAGLYLLHVDHDGKDVPAEGRKAFVHVPRLHLAGGLKTTSGDNLLQATGGFLDSLPLCPSLNDSDSFFTSVNN